MKIGTTTNSTAATTQPLKVKDVKRSLKREQSKSRGREKHR
jgi:hypothetical protein